MQTQIKIYVGTYAKYNNGSIAGDWFDLSDYSDAAELMAAMAECHDDEKDPEYMIQDKEGPRCITKAIDESMTKSEWDAIYQAIDEAEDSHIDIEVIDAYCENMGGSILDNKISDIEEAYSGEYGSNEEFAEDMADQLGYEIPNQWPYRCIDWEYAARELMYDYFESNGHYFRNL